MKLTIFGATGGTGTCLVGQAIAAGHDVTAVVRDPARLAVAGHPAAGGAASAGNMAAGSHVAAASGSMAAAGQVAAGQVAAGQVAAGQVAAGQVAAGHAAGGGRLRVVTADLLDPAAIVPAVAGADAVLSAIGPHGAGPTTISQDSARAIIEAMRQSGASRLLMVSGSIVTDEGEGSVMRYLVKPLARRTTLRNVCADMRRAEDEVRRSGLDWTIIRPPRLTARAATGSYRTALDRNLPRGYTISRADLAACMLTLAAGPTAVRRHVGVAS